MNRPSRRYSGFTLADVDYGTITFINSQILGVTYIVMGIVELETACKKYGDVVAVEGTTLTIKDGELITLVGPSGCGKTTTLELIAGLQQPTSGTVSIDGEVVNGLPPMARDIAMVFQNIALYPHMSVRGNMEFPLKLRDFPEEVMETKIEKAADLLGIFDLLDRQPKELSGGQQQRVGIGRAIVREPEVFLLDEPLANLDAKLRVDMRAEIQRIQKNLETTMVYVTHDQLEAMTISDRIVVMNHGEVMQVGKPVELYMNPTNRFVASFIGSPSMNFFDCRFNSPKGAVTSSAFTLSLTPELRTTVQEGLESEFLTLGVRHEDVFLSENHDGAREPSEPFEATVELIEPIGEYQFLYLDIGMNERLLASVDPLLTVEEGEQVEVIIDMNRMHLFDEETGDALLREHHKGITDQDVSSQFS